MIHPRRRRVLPVGLIDLILPLPGCLPLLVVSFIEGAIRSDPWVTFSLATKNLWCSTKTNTSSTVSTTMNRTSRLFQLRQPSSHTTTQYAFQLTWRRQVDRRRVCPTTRHRLNELYLETQFVFDDMKSAFALCKRYSKHNSRVKIFANRTDADNFVQQQRESTTHTGDLNISIEPVTKPITNDAEKLPYSDVPTSELTKLYNVVDKGDDSEFERLI